MNQGRIPGSHELGFVEQRIVEASAAPLKKTLPHSRGLRVFSMGECNIIIARENPDGSDDFRWHLTISCERRHPTWDEIKVARYRLLPLDICVAMCLPPPEMYVNIRTQDHVFHVWEIRDDAEPWRDE